MQTQKESQEKSQKEFLDSGEPKNDLNLQGDSNFCV